MTKTILHIVVEMRVRVITPFWGKKPVKVLKVFLPTMDNNWSFIFISVPCCVNLANKVEDSFKIVKFASLRPFSQLEKLNKTGAGYLHQIILKNQPCSNKILNPLCN